MGKKLHANLSVRIFTDQKCFGPGVAELLHRVDELHSLRAAAMSMSMAYSKAWTVVRNAEAGLGFKLLKSSTGGRNGGGAELTEEAQRMIATYEDYCEKLHEYGDRLFEKMFAFYPDLVRENDS